MTDAHLPDRPFLNLSSVVGRGRILVGREGRVRRPGAVAEDLLHVAAQAKQQRVHRVAAGGEQAAAAGLLSA